MTQKELIHKVAILADLDEVQTYNFVKALTDILIEEVSASNDISIEDFGDFEIRKRSEYILLDTETGKRKLMPPSVNLTFTSVYDHVNFALEESIEKDLNSAFNNFEPTLLNDGVELEGVEVVVEGQDEVYESYDEEEENLVGEGSFVEGDSRFEKRSEEINKIEKFEEVSTQEIVEESNDNDGNAVVEKIESEVVTEAEDEYVENEIANDIEGEDVVEEVDNLVDEVEPAGVSDIEDEVLNEVKEDSVVENENYVVDKIKHEPEPPKKRIRDIDKRRKNISKSTIIIPIIGGVVIALASLFFFKKGEK